MAANSDIDPADPPSSVEGIGPNYEKRLESAGYDDVQSLQDATFEELSGVNGFPIHVARSVKDRVGSNVEPLTTVAAAKERAQQVPGAKAKVVRDENGRTHGKVLRKVDERHMDGATMEIHKG